MIELCAPRTLRGGRKFDRELIDGRASGDQIPPLNWHRRNIDRSRCVHIILPRWFHHFSVLILSRQQKGKPHSMDIQLCGAYIHVTMGLYTLYKVFLFIDKLNEHISVHYSFELWISRCVIQHLFFPLLNGLEGGDEKSMRKNEC